MYGQPPTKPAGLNNCDALYAAAGSPGVQGNRKCVACFPAEESMRPPATFKNIPASEGESKPSVL